MKKKTIKAWAGIANGHIDKIKGVQYGFNEEPNLRAIYTSKKQAKVRYQKIIQVEIIY